MWIATALTIIGSILNAMQKKIGFYVWIMSNVMWTIQNFINADYAQMTIYIFNTVICVIGIIKWSTTTTKKKGVK